MDFEKIQFTMIGKHVKIFTDSLKKVQVNVDLECPFGNEYNNHMIYNNWILDETNLKLFQNIEESFKNHMIEQYSISSQWTWKSSIRKNSRFGSLLRTTNTMGYDYEKEYSFSVDITIDSIWLHKGTKTFGLMLHC
jgi:hypothetical protein